MACIIRRRVLGDRRTKIYLHTRLMATHTHTRTCTHRIIVTGVREPTIHQKGPTTTTTRGRVKSLYYTSTPTREGPIERERARRKSIRTPELSATAAVEGIIAHVASSRRQHSDGLLSRRVGGAGRRGDSTRTGLVVHSFSFLLR